MRIFEFSTNMAFKRIISQSQMLARCFSSQNFGTKSNMTLPPDVVGKRHFSNIYGFVQVAVSPFARCISIIAFFPWWL